MAADLSYTGDEREGEYVDEDICVHTALHPSPKRERDQPARAADDVLVWMYGEVYGFDGPEGYDPRPREEGASVATYCARLYDEYGIDFVRSLNGTFVGIVYDPNRQTVRWFTDRLGSRSVFYYRLNPETVVFSTRIQSLSLHSSVETVFDTEYLCEYFAIARVGGVKTPLADVKELPPASIVRFDLETGTVKSERYWQPVYDPIEASFSSFVDQFVDCFRTVLDERIEDDLDYGLLLSGGSDSRAILAALNDEIELRTYHLAGWMSPEARAAERAAMMSENGFRLLLRDRDYQKRALEGTPPMMNFHGRFDQAHIAEFADGLREEVDVVISGLYSDMLFRGGTLSDRLVSLGPIGTLRLPMADRPTTLDGYIEGHGKLPAYLDSSSRLSEILRRNVRRSRDSIVHHGVPYRSIDEVVISGEYYPLSNDPDLFYHGLTQSMPHWTPFLDNRLIDLALRVPLRYQVRRDVVNRSVEVLDPALAEIRHGDTGVPLKYSFPIDHAWYLAYHFFRKHVSNRDPPQQYLGHSPWSNNAELIRHHDFVIETIYENEALIRELPFLSWEGVLECYREHLAGADNTTHLYTLLSFLRMPLTRRIAGKQRGTDEPYE